MFLYITWTVRKHRSCCIFDRERLEGQMVLREVRPSKIGFGL